MRSYRSVSACGYVCDPAKGYPTGGVTVGIPFERITDQWICPVCGAKKHVFRMIK